jgi:tRNA threonylcarbamoyladenosine biosynthesis protein TsaB
MNILALDSSTLTGSVCVVADGVVLAESSARVRATHSEQLLPLVHECLSRAALALDAIDRIAVGIGPGSFTGVRVALATAKGLHLATGTPLVGVRSLDALLASAWGARGFVLAALDARRDEVFATLAHVTPCARTFTLDALQGRPERVGADSLAACGDAPLTIVTDLDDTLLDRLTACAPERFCLAPRVAGTPLARYVAWEALVGNGRNDAGSLEPEYFRGSDAKLPGGVKP